MAMTIRALERSLKKGLPDLLFEVDHEQERIGAGFTMEEYQDSEGDKTLVVCLSLLKKGEYLELCCLNLYDASASEHKGALCRLLAGISLRTPLVQFGFDEDDGEVRASVELVLADGLVSPIQLATSLNILVNVVDRFHPYVVRAMTTGEISFPGEDTKIRPTLDEQESDGGDSVSIDLGETLKGMLAATREAGRRRLENEGPARTPTRHL